MVKVPCIDDDRSVSLTRVLVVEDYERFRRFVCSMLVKRQDFEIVGEATDGLEAVHKTEELRPDLVLLDIGLPGLNGIEAARQILALVPECKIVFLSQEDSAEVVQEAFRLGARGYVVKTQAASELLPAMEAVRDGGQFVSSTHRESLLRPGPGNAEISRSHKVQFYLDDPSFLAGLARFVEDALKAGKAVIVIMTEPHHKGLLERLQARGGDSAAAMEQGRYIALDVAETLSAFMTDGMPDPVRFFKVAGDLIGTAVKAAEGDLRVSACGECAPVLWAQGNGDAAVKLEHLWDEVAKMYDVDVLCGYVLQSPQREQDGDIYEKIREAHSAVCTL
jgi:DNA-binding NarL/FixJ family response regulator